MKRVIITLLALTLLTGIKTNSSTQQVPVVGGYQLLTLPREYEHLKVKDARIRGGVATIRITGELSVAGVCDEPRIE